MQVTGASAIVTGAASGLGFATAQHLSALGAKVVIADLPSSPGAERAAEIGAQFVPVDVTDPDQVSVAVATAVAAGPLRVAVNCAGVATPGRVLRDGIPLDLDSYTRVLMINLVGTFNVLRLAAAAMATNDLSDGDRGVVINTASCAAYDGQVGQAAYSAAKGGIAASTISLARDLAETAIRVVAIAPGMFDTALLAGLPSKATDSLAEQVPHPSRLGRPAEFAELVAHIAFNGMINGEVIRLDGALRMAPR